MIMSVTLAHGAIRLAKKHVIVKRLTALEDLGSIDIFCTDKTGTLTEGAITLVRHVDPEGNENERTLLFALLNATHQTGLRSPLDVAILRHEHDSLPLYLKVDELPFDFQRRRLSVIVEGENKKYLIAKGAPESILEVSTSYEINGQQKMLDAATRELCNATFNSLSRVIASLASPSGKFQPNTPHIFQLMRRVNLSFWVSQRFLIRPKNLSRLHCTHCNGMVSKLKC